MTYNTEAIILKKRTWRENDLEIIFLSKELGKMRAVAVGAKKMLSKLSGHLEPFKEVKLMVAEGKGCDKIGQAITLNNFCFQGGESNFNQLLRAQEASNLLEKILAEKQKEENFFQLTKNFFFLNFKNKESNFLPLFKWQAAALAGFKPRLHNCIFCQTKIKGKYEFNLTEAGAVCSKCFIKNNQEFVDVSLRTGQILKYLVEKAGLKEAWVKITKETAEELNNLFEKFYLYQIIH
ncbi:MAG: repair protein RecO protein [Candidatus Magasanikbacteria bacterium GW2011_GWC2_40_17]|uniref:DNA repair protein RecO n=1 Tax=Candidatus Magasanikbacteria bacterium GW2011_GWA2_42_32 TaxID=1619039 RepID=A0A0G1A6Y1_9BACT|nr:MAG: repair protein RecO protein [Candidatus Magasanikbacteria bacterium GW2011_GWC2_40_17]KKS56780.1 MAG: repair protein RecO protein [Candidatus Magasanikbacteria bacterium GW2011_GWA2_42_32]OGH86032.1 MAG: DNA repair protein RecO [Candidatus Magasanikbacteria bacterium RIFOXYB2_FULL_38_10]